MDSLLDIIGGGSKIQVIRHTVPYYSSIAADMLGWLKWCLTAAAASLKVQLLLVFECSALIRCVLAKHQCSLILYDRHCKFHLNLILIITLGGSSINNCGGIRKG